MLRKKTVPPAFWRFPKAKEGGQESRPTSFQKRFNRSVQFLQVGQIDIHHVAGIELDVGDVRAVGRVQRHVVYRVMHRVNRADQVAASAADQDAHVRVLVHDGGQAFGGAGVGVAVAVIPRLHTGQNFVGQVVLEFQLAANVTVDGRGKRSAGGGGGRVEVRVRRRRVVVAPGDARVIGAQNQSFVVQQLFAEHAGINPQIVIGDNIGFQSGKPRQLLDDFLAPGGGQGVALLQGGNVFAAGKGTRLSQGVGQIRL